MIYLDHAAATPVSEQVLAAMTPYLTTDFFNPSAPYLPAAHIRQDYETAKNQIANFIGAKGNDLLAPPKPTLSPSPLLVPPLKRAQNPRKHPP